MRKKYMSLTKEQIDRDVIFSSQLYTGSDDDTIHEVTKENINDVSEFARNKSLNKIDLLLDDKFFNNSHYKYNLIRR